MATKLSVPIEDDQFEDMVLNAHGVVVVDFWAPRCGTCLQMAPALETFAAANEGTAKIYTLDVDDNPKTSERLEIRSVPTVIFFMNGQVQHISRGAMSAVSLQNKLNELLSQAQSK
ncbi:Thioredoxin [uncultured Desulfobacterium sp.]|uniref:Thioredoxin n=1 Tax=uncultured Desulfobacterium sp. TaxID=201089 RepID=A0A445MUD0_9BACT|nr:Thioredoxin [uncultured Desulfobacterium sp.]